MSKQENAKNHARNRITIVLASQHIAFYLKEGFLSTLHHYMYDKHYKNSILQTSKEYYEDLILSQQRIDSSTLCCRKKLPTQNNGPFGKNGKLWIGNYWAPKTSETTKKLFINNSTTDQICFGHKNQPFLLVEQLLPWFLHYCFPWFSTSTQDLRYHFQCLEQSMQVPKSSLADALRLEFN